MAKQKHNITEDLKHLKQSAAQLSSDPANARKHSKRNIEAIAASLAKFGQRKPIIVQKDGMVVRAGNGTLEAAKSLGWSHVAAVVIDDDNLTATQFAIADNRTAELAEWDEDALAQTLASLQNDESIDELTTGFTAEEIEQMIGKNEVRVGGEEDEVPAPPVDPVTQPGDLILLGEHRLLCGDSTRADDVARLMGGATAVLLHADPPYGMGKEAEGVQNDNLYRDKLDRFQMDWWRTFRPHLADNASAYIWGNAPDLWRLWYVGGLADSERLTIRNEIVWAKGSAGAGGISHMGADGLRQYPNETERCLFFMLGEQGFNNNADNYWEGFDPIRKYLDGERRAMGWDMKTIAAWFGFHPRMADHWFSVSQWSFIRPEQYARLRAEAKGKGFKREHDELKREHDELKREHDELKRAFYATRAYFDNTHDNMTDVWEFNRVTGEDRHGHATPKPVTMICRAIKSSTPEGAIVAEPFLGSGTTLIAAEQLGRKCYGMEISPQYCDVIVQRWEDFTGKKARKVKK